MRRSGRAWGPRPAEILAARRETLVEICRTGGIHADLRAERLREIAAIIHYHFHGDLSSVLKLPPNKAIKELTRLPSIAAPGAEKILLFTRTVPLLALESNGVRVLARIFFGEEQKNYASTYRAIREVVADQTGDDCDWLISTHQLLQAARPGMLHAKPSTLSLVPLIRRLPLCKS